jgi:hypothetical protein
LNGTSVYSSGCQVSEYPEFASNMRFELWEIDGVKYVKIKYNGQYMKICSQKYQECPFTDFIE